MKREMVVVLILLLAVTSVSALKLDFSISGDVTDIQVVNSIASEGDTSGSLVSGPGTITWVPSSVGGNNYVTVYTAWTDRSYSSLMINKNAALTTYAAATNLGGSGSGGVHSVAVILLGSSYNILYYYRFTYSAPRPLGSQYCRRESKHIQKRCSSSNIPVTLC